LIVILVVPAAAIPFLAVTSSPSSAFVLAAGRMTLNAVLQIDKPHSRMFSFYLLRLMSMAAVASVRLECRLRGVACRTGYRPHPASAVVEWESMLEGGAFPGGRRVALGAAGPEFPFVDARFGVAGAACLLRPLEDIFPMAGFAIDPSVHARQLEGGAIVVEAGHFGQGRVSAVVFGVTAAALCSIG
jgi:hypothetical protein